MQVSSQIGQGSTFQFILTLDIAKDFPRYKELHFKLSPENKLHDLKVLIVEGKSTITELLTSLDNPINQMVLVNMLNKLGLSNIVCAENGKEGLELFKSSYRSQQGFDIVFSDICMPQLNGYELAESIVEFKELTGNKSESVLVAMTANSCVETKNQCLAKGFDVFAMKPFTIKELSVCVDRCVELLNNLKITKDSQEPEK